MLTANKVTVAFEDGAIPFSNLSFEVKDHQILAVLGASGLGKTSLLKTLAGIHPVKSGSILYKGEALNVNKHRIGYVPQSYGLYPWHTVEKNITLSRRIRKMPEDLAFLNEIMTAFGLNQLMDRSPSRLSGGELQRVALARAFYLMPDLFLLDEPFSALDEITKDTAYGLFERIWQQTKPMTLLVTHNLDEALRFGDSILVLGSQGSHQLVNPKRPEAIDGLRKDLRARLLEGRAI